ncbi:MAG: hypothetical protein ABII13_03370 [Patescibacteria group bacterium]|nr:hypothetical protein [Patescibacteria group bacterium]MBU2509462.1 hypothetical protein [Patescibacteria group bacterium]
MPAKNPKKQKAVAKAAKPVKSAKPSKVAYQPPPAEVAAPTPKPTPRLSLKSTFKKVMPTPAPTPSRAIPNGGSKTKSSMWFHVALIAVAILGFVVLFLKIHMDTNQVKADIGRLDSDLKAVQMDVRSTNEKATKLKTAMEDLSIVLTKNEDAAKETETATSTTEE